MGGVDTQQMQQRQTGDRRQETGDRRQETGDRRQETGDRRQETGVAAYGHRHIYKDNSFSLLTNDVSGNSIAH